MSSFCPTPLSGIARVFSPISDRARGRRRKEFILLIVFLGSFLALAETQIFK